MDKLSQADKDRIIQLIQEGQPLPKEDIYKLTADEEDVFLFWNGRSETTTNAVLPFHHIEHIDEPRQEVQEEGTMFSMFDTKGRQKTGWHNKLIWGDNKLILSSLLHGPLRQEIEAEGGLKLIYIDPPFAVGADFSHTIEINGESATKSQSVLEEIAYRDTWQRGISSYLSMMYERLKLMHSLLAEDGSIYVHCDWRVSSFLRIILGDIFSNEYYRNEIIWKRSTAHSDSSGFGNLHDTIIYFTKSPSYSFTTQYEPYSKEYIKTYYRHSDNKGRFLDRDLSAKGLQGGGYKYKWKEKEGLWRCPKETMERYEKEGRIYYTKTGTPRYKQYLEEMPGVPCQDIWTDIYAVNSQASERIGYPTQKPEALLERIIQASSNEGDLVADFFCGSGTTAAVAEKLNRKWLATDLGRFAIHTTRKRMIQVQRELQEKGQDFRAFEILNLGKYERQFFLQELNEAQQRSRQAAYLDLILRAYKAQPAEGHTQLHGRRGERMVHVGPLDVPVTQTRVQAVFEECQSLGYSQVDVLGFEFEMGLVPRVIQEYADAGVRVRLRYIPKEVFDPRAVNKGQVKFYDVSYLRATAEKDKDGKVIVTLRDFVTNYTQDDLDAVEDKLRKGGSQVVIENGQIIKVSKDKNGVQKREPLTTEWHDWIDYWSVDFDYDSKKEIIRLQAEDGTVEEKWTGNYIFENEWQSFRTKQDRTLEFTSAPRVYEKPGKYRIMVKVVDILGVDTSQLLEVEVR
ncbi:MAG: site-specific DNA-methyltransferase [Phaeodactylibacter xiamenensis]|uniref:site-specific DNA-methyltransferase (adenine-specific) n=1 Tax=Phaeodactylibacter xiamenensis TaxID=1524460 RepID=A0A098SDS4_9BACT|nr:site-specific DNA-methyltransferase [Phaeodactylibacter xiamenensis]KGE89162.1 DNA methylase [Phaeodactylibacter xiamenensis]MCR9050296.1 site-specific DNA-methyltransferase [bacterium]